MVRRRPIRRTAAVLLTCVAACAPDPAASSRLWPTVAPDTNLIVVSFDALRADALGAYGSRAGASPNIDAFAAGALVFENAYSVAPVTPTSFAAAWTGLLPHRVFRGWEFVADAPVASVLGRNGRVSVAAVNSVQLTPERGFDRGFDEYRSFNNIDDGTAARDALAMLAAVHDRSFFAWIHLLPPHAPYEYHPEAEHLYTDGYSGEFARSSGLHFAPQSPADERRLRELYLGHVHYADAIFAELIAGLDRLGLRSRSVVVLTADHGEEFLEHGRYQHGELFEEHLRIPMIVSHPGVPRGARIDAPYTNLDFLPTMAGMLGIQPPASLDGVDVAVPTVGDRVFAVISMTGGERRSVGLRFGGFKLIEECLPENKFVLYDLVADPAERFDALSEHRSAAASAKRTLDAALGGSGCEVINAAARGLPITSGLSPETIRGLQDLGYIR